MTPASQQVREDFDRIAALSGESGNNEVHLPFLLRSLPRSLGYVLEIGCGTGALSRSLARVADRVVALDLSPEMIRLARERAKNEQRIEYHVADVLDWRVEKDTFDCVVSVATLHHLCYEAVLPKIGQALRPGGCLEFLFAKKERTYFQKRSTFFTASILEQIRNSAREADHRLKWMSLEEAVRSLFHESHRWAVRHTFNPNRR